jgi:RHH-type proline utilization regulon transcriptional repressor/proline dehydrogenase/delta 1-pyrroline-5-carboxylate dehydrogenase
LDPAEQEHWLEHVEVGNAYVNRHITGAIVGRQPFGGWKRSSVGPGAKTGGPTDVLRFVRVSGGPPADSATGAAFARWWSTHVEGVDRTGLRAEQNVLRQRPDGPVLARVGSTDGRSIDGAALDLLRLASRVSGIELRESGPDEAEGALAARLIRGDVARLRVLAPVGELVRRAAHAAGVVIDPAPVVAVPEVELPHWGRAQAVSATRHRHGRLMSQPSAGGQVSGI